MHAGFKVAWEEIRDTVVENVEAARAAYPSYKTVFTGHSLGGAVGTIAAAPVPGHGLGEAIADRLSRAAADRGADLT